ncbi:MAG: hypothetical protein H7Y13_16360 [Sphingobacteriaceae bacterium]|nr:hypothetical protein [Sphingobacteriaceae bacterium]
MKDLTTLKTLQTNYQSKFATLLQLQEELSLSGTDASESAEYLTAKEEWIKAGDELKTHLEQSK